MTIWWSLMSLYMSIHIVPPSSFWQIPCLTAFSTKGWRTSGGMKKLSSLTFQTTFNTSPKRSFSKSRYFFVWDISSETERDSDDSTEFMFHLRYEANSSVISAALLGFLWQRMEIEFKT